MVCPFMSKTNGLNTNPDKLFPCIDSCSLRIGKECAIKVLAKSQIQNNNDIKDIIKNYGV